MPILTWLKRSQLKRVEQKLRRLRAKQRYVREQEAELKKERDRGDATAHERRQESLHAQMEDLTREINHLVAEEERLKHELDPADEGKAASS